MPRVALYSDWANQRSFTAYMQFNAIKRHMQKKEYDYFQYGGKIRQSFESFAQSKRNFLFQKLAEKNNYHKIILANVLEKSNVWVSDILSDQGWETYTNWNNRTQNIHRLVMGDVVKIPSNSFNQMFKIDESQKYPLVIQCFLDQVISTETLIVLLRLAKPVGYWDKYLSEDKQYVKLISWLRKYDRFFNRRERNLPNFITYDHNKTKQSIINQYTTT